MKEHRIAKIEVDLVAYPVKAGLSDATRKVETIGFLVVRMTTDQGLEGFGITYHEVGGEATKSLIDTNIAPRLIGCDPLQTEQIWLEMSYYLRGVGRKGLTYCALSAVDIALWDLKGKIFDIPLYRLFGGSQTQVPVYASGGWTSYDDDQLIDEMKQMTVQGYTTIKMKVGVEGGQNIMADVRRVRKVREAVGDSIAILLDANNCWDSATAVQFATYIQDYHIMLLEEPVFADDIPGLKRFRRQSSIPLATGEHEYTKFGARDLVLNEAADFLQMDGTRAGGFTEMLKIAAITQAWNIKFAPHAMEHIHMHLISAYANAPFLERLLLFEDVTNHLYLNAPMPKNGFIEIPQKPGLGLDLNMDYIREQNK